MFSKGEIIFGIPWSEGLEMVNTANQNGDPRDYGFTKLYHGSHSRFVGYLGVKLGEIDCAADYIEMPELLKYQPKEKHFAQVQTLINDLPEHLKVQVEKVTTFIVWYTS